MIFGLGFQHMITVHGPPTVILLPPHLVRVLRALMLSYLALFTQQKTHLSTHIPFSIALRGLGLVPWGMVPVATALPKTAHSITFLQEEVLQKQSPHRTLHVRRLACVPFIQRLQNRKVQRAGNS